MEIVLIIKSKYQIEDKKTANLKGGRLLKLIDINVLDIW